MTEVYKNLFVFNQREYNDTDFNLDEWSFCLATKENFGQAMIDILTGKVKL